MSLKASGRFVRTDIIESMLILSTGFSNGRFVVQKVRKGETSQPQCFWYFSYVRQ